MFILGMVCGCDRLRSRGYEGNNILWWFAEVGLLKIGEMFAFPVIVQGQFIFHDLK